VRNRFNITAHDFYVKLYIDDIEVDAVKVDALAGGGSEVIELHWTAVEGTHAVKITAEGDIIPSATPVEKYDIIEVGAREEPEGMGMTFQIIIGVIFLVVVLLIIFAVMRTVKGKRKL
jgi:uncharacterized integral membrane protein